MRNSEAASEPEDLLLSRIAQALCHPESPAEDQWCLSA